MVMTDCLEQKLLTGQRIILWVRPKISGNPPGLVTNSTKPGLLEAVRLGPYTGQIMALISTEDE
jgi:hypothetical protein